MGKGQRGDQYESAMDSYNKLNELYGNYAKQYTGNAGYNNSLQQAANGAGIVAQNEAAQTANAVRNTAGMTRAQAAAMGQNAINNSYGNNFQTQQNNAYNAGNDALSAVNQQSANTLQGAQTEQQESQNRHDRTWNNIANTTAIASQVATPFNETFASGTKAVSNAIK